MLKGAGACKLEWDLRRMTLSICGLKGSLDQKSSIVIRPVV